MRPSGVMLRCGCLRPESLRYRTVPDQRSDGRLIPASSSCPVTQQPPRPDGRGGAGRALVGRNEGPRGSCPQRRRGPSSPRARTPRARGPRGGGRCDPATSWRSSPPTAKLPCSPLPGRRPLRLPGPRWCSGPHSRHRSDVPTSDPDEPPSTTGSPEVPTCGWTRRSGGPAAQPERGAVAGGRRPQSGVDPGRARRGRRTVRGVDLEAVIGGSSEWPGRHEPAPAGSLPCGLVRRTLPASPRRSLKPGTRFAQDVRRIEP